MMDSSLDWTSVFLLNAPIRASGLSILAFVEFALHPQHEASFVSGRRPVQDFKQEAIPSKGLKSKGIKREQRDNYEHW